MVEYKIYIFDINMKTTVAEALFRVHTMAFG